MKKSPAILSFVAGYNFKKPPRDCQQEKVSSAPFIIKIIGECGNKQQACSQTALQQQINQYKCCKQPQENAAMLNENVANDDSPADDEYDNSSDEDAYEAESEKEEEPNGKLAY